METKEIKLVCEACGVTANYLTCLEKYGKPPLRPCFDISTYHDGVCDLCKHERPVTEVRDFFYPHFDLIFNKFK